jgi:hypothetical protein
VAVWVVVIVGFGGEHHTNAARTALGLTIIAAYVGQLVLAFSAPTVETPSPPVRRARWLWLSVIPLLGSGLPALAGFRARVWWWVLLGVVCEGFVVDAIVQNAQSDHPDHAQAAKIGGVLLIGWLGGAVVSMLIRPAYERRVLGTVTERVWPAPTEPARALSPRYALGACVAAMALIAVVVSAEKTSNSDVLLGAANIVGETLTVALLIPLIRSRGLRARDLGLRAGRHVGSTAADLPAGEAVP